MFESSQALPLQPVSSQHAEYSSTISVTIEAFSDPKPYHVVSMSGRFDQTNVDVEDARIKDYLQNQVRPGETVIFNLDGLEYTNSKGGGAFVGWYILLENKDCQFVICSMCEEMRNIFDVMSILSLFVFYDNLDQAKQSLA